MKKKVNLYIIEEHHEAFYIWIEAVKNGEIASTGNTLLHFDDHSDMSTSNCNESLHNIFEWPSERIKEFVYSNLTIASFITTACFLKIFDEIQWIQFDGQPSYKDAYVTSYNDNFQNIISGVYYEGNPLLEFAHHQYRYLTSSLPVLNFAMHDNVCLDIDLDFFSCNINPENSEEIIIEVTEDEYQNFKANPYHKLRYAVNRLDCIQKGDHYYMIINYHNKILPSHRKIDFSEIEQRVAAFFEKIDSLAIMPKLITICRSRYSGYTPEDQWKFIENKLIDGLTKRFEINKIAMHD